VLYAEADKTLNCVATFLADPARSIERTLRIMLSTNHLGTEAAPQVHPLVASVARELLTKSENERSGVVSTAMSLLGLYRDPIVAGATTCCDWRIADLIDRARPVSLYLVLPPSDISRTRPLVRHHDGTPRPAKPRLTSALALAIASRRIQPGNTAPPDDAGRGPAAAHRCRARAGIGNAAHPCPQAARRQRDGSLINAPIEPMPAQQVRIARLSVHKQCICNLDELGSCGLHLPQRLFKLFARRPLLDGIVRSCNFSLQSDILESS